MKTFLIIDANALIHRAFHALPPLTSPSGEPIGAVYGLASSLLRFLIRQPADQKPDYWVAAFDRPEPTFRKEAFEKYKAQRPQAPDELISQIIKSHELLEKFGIKSFEKPGFEADDFIATLAKKFGKDDIKAIILTGDLDTLQLVEDEKVVVMTPKKGLSELVIYDEEAVRKRFGLNPNQMVDYKALVGDPSDNIKGVPGIGPKTAVSLLKEYGTIEGVYSRVNEIKNKNLAKKLSDNKETAEFCKKLVLLKDDIELDVGLEDLAFKELNVSALKEYFEELGFKSLIERLDSGEAVLLSSSRGSEESLFVFGKQATEGKKRELKGGKLKIGFDFKSLIKELRTRGVETNGPFFDLGIAGWLIDPDQKDFSPGALSRRFLKKEFDGSREAIQELFAFCNAKLDDYGLRKVFEEFEMPLIPILADMEETGIMIDRKILSELSRDFQEQIDELVHKIYKTAGSEFNLNSPKQLSDILFNRLKLKPLSRSKKSLSTQAENLLQLKNQHPIIDLILKYREFFKLESTYLEPIAQLTSKDGRLRTTFDQTGTATGRLASKNPNLQNVPPALRKVFVAPSDFFLLSFDYSQLELRILASVSGDEKMREAFFENKDIHSITASNVFNVPLEKVDKRMRKMAKTLNFGVVYGMGPRAFAKSSGLSQEEAQTFIDEYFSDFKKVKEWQEEVKRQAASLGYVSNLNGRRRWFLQMALGNPRLQSEFERAAINMPVQSLGADIIKLAMIKTSEFLREKKWHPEKARLLLSIHDELLFEVKEEIVEEAKKEIKEIMEDIYKLEVPLKVEVEAGKNWEEAK